ncbi:hypothetical protein P9112_000882 [Eukaryota sp. TZLM1-RC]
MFEQFKLPCFPKDRRPRDRTIRLCFSSMGIGLLTGVYDVTMQFNYHHIPHFLALVGIFYIGLYAIRILHEVRADNVPLASLATIVLICGVLLTITIVWLTFFNPDADDFSECDGKDKNRGRFFSTLERSCFPRCNSDKVEILVVHNDDVSKSRCLPINCGRVCYVPPEHDSS